MFNENEAQNCKLEKAADKTMISLAGENGEDRWALQQQRNSNGSVLHQKQQYIVI